MTEQSGARVELRTNLFVLATIAAISASGPVKIRNLSPSGALIEGAALPSQGERVQLRRGKKAVHGEVVWSEEGRAGLRFDGRVNVAEWMPCGDAGQQRVDQVVQQCKTGAVNSPALAAPSAPQLGGLDPSEVLKIVRSLDALADELAADSAVVSRHGVNLQTLDIAANVLRKLTRPTIR